MLLKDGKSNKLEGWAQPPELLTRPETNDVKCIPNIQNKDTSLKKKSGWEKGGIIHLEQTF